MSLEGRVALVSGASSGLGRHFAKVLAEAGARVALAARRLEELEAAAGEIRADGGEALAVAMDVSERASVEEALNTVDAELGTATIVVANAGVARSGWFSDISEEDWRHVMNVNLDGVYRLGQAAVRRMVAADSGGSIINIASVLGIGVDRRVASYAVSKAAVIQLTRAMALEVAGDKIRVNAIAPGYFASEMTQNYLSSEAGRRFLESVPLGRAGQQGELDGALLLLASEAGAYMTGSVITVDGGTLLSIS